MKNAINTALNNALRPVVAASLLACAGLAQADINIGISLPLTGPASGLGIPMSNAIKLLAGQHRRREAQHHRAR